MKQLEKRLRASLCFVPMLLLLGGCWDRTELNDLAIVTALAFDQAENGLIRTTVQVVVPQNQGGGPTGTGSGGGQSGKRTTVRSAAGFDAADALSKLQRLSPRRLFWGQCKVFIFSEKVARSGIHDHLDFLLRFPKIRERAYMYVSKGGAAEALDLFPLIERSTSEVLRELNDLQIGMRVTLQQLSAMLTGDARASGLPLVQILPKGRTSEPYQTVPYIFGTAVFKEDKMVGEISERITRGVLWLRDEIGEHTVDFGIPGKEGRIALKPINAKIRLVPSIRNGEWMMTVKVRTEGDIIQNGTDLNPMHPDVVATLDKAFGQEVHRRIRMALQEAQHRLKADIFGFAKEFHRNYPKEWEKVKDRWEQQFPEIKVKTEIEAHIQRPGSINYPGGIPGEEVRKK